MGIANSGGVGSQRLGAAFGDDHFFIRHVFPFYWKSDLAILSDAHLEVKVTGSR
jgi:hypothetical protein